MSELKELLPNVASPYISIIIPVYNTEKYLRSCLMSAVFQTISEVEVIVVNDASPDGSQRIIDEFVRLFPQRVRSIVHETNQGLAYARRTGLNAAKAPYVLFVDSDDFISGQICEELLTDAVSRDLDIDFFPLLRYWTKNKKRETLYPPKQDDQETLIKNGLAAFCGALFRREFLLEQTDVAFVPTAFEDAAAMPALISRAKRVGTFTKKNYYFYRYERTGSICEQQISRQKMEDCFQADFTAFKNVLPKWKSAYDYRMLKRACASFRNDPSVYDYALSHLKEALRECEYHQEKFSSSYQGSFQTALNSPNHISIPKVVYLNGYMRDQIVDFSRYELEAKKAYLFDPAVRSINPDPCAESSLPRWLSACSPEEKGLYFILKEIVSHGGMYISPAVRVTTSFNREAFQDAFFVSGGNASVLLCAFGGEKGSSLLSQILRVVEQPDVKWKRTSIADCVAHVLIGERGVHLDGKEEFGRDGLHIISFPDAVRSLSPKQSYSILDYSNLKGIQEELVSLPSWMSDFAWKCAEETFAAQCESNDALKSASKKKASAKTTKKERSVREKIIAKMKATPLYQLAKKIYHSLLG